MHVFFEPDFPVGRTHPWTCAEYDMSLKYYDFKEFPNLITEVLEDFKQWDHFPAVQTFYGLLRWINGRHSLFESNDCAFKFPDPNTNPHFDKKLQSAGRLMILFRNVLLNLTIAHTNWLKENIFSFLKKRDTAFNWGVIGISVASTQFLVGDNPVGQIVVLRFWSFGNTDNEVMRNLDRLLKNLLTCLRFVSEDLKNRQDRVSKGVYLVNK